MAEPLKLQGGGEYNLDVVKEVKVTDSFLSMDEEERGCQNKEDYQDCTTRHYIDQVKKTCKCVPLYLKINDEVIIIVCEAVTECPSDRVTECFADD